MKVNTIFFIMLFAFFSLSISGCIFPPEDDDPNDPILQKVLRIEAYLYVGDAEYLFQYKDGSNDITANGAHYIWFNTIEGTDSYKNNVFRSDFDANVLGKKITGFLEARTSSGGNQKVISVDAKRVSESNGSKTTYELTTGDIPKISQDTVDDIIEVKFESKGFAGCSSGLKSTSYVFEGSSFTKTMTNYNCTDDSKITVSVFFKK